jgi:hypothetical protein
MTTYYKATFSDGTVLKRSTKSRTYTHAWLVRRKNNPEAVAKYGLRESADIFGFCGSEQLARYTMPRYRYGEVLFAEIAPAVAVTRKEYGS